MTALLSVTGSVAVTSSAAGSRYASPIAGRVDDEHHEGEPDGGRDLDPMASANRFARGRIADRDDQRQRGEGAADRPPRVVDELEQEEVREEKDEQARVAIEESEEVVPGGGAEPHSHLPHDSAARVG